MNECFEILIRLLEKETASYRFLLDILEKETEAVVTANLIDLNETVIQKEKLCKTIQSLELKRAQITKDIADHAQYKLENLTLSNLLEIADKTYSKRLAGLQADLSNLTKKVSEVNGKNRSLLNHSVEFVRQLLSLFGKAIQPEKTYAQTGKVKEQRTTGILLFSKA